MANAAKITKITIQSPKLVIWTELCKAHDAIEAYETHCGKLLAQHKETIASFETMAALYEKMVGLLKKRLAAYEPAPEPSRKFRVIDNKSDNKSE